MKHISTTVFSVIALLTGTIGDTHAFDNFDHFEKHVISEGGNIVLNFSEPIYVKNGDITIYKSADNSVFETIDVRSSQITGTGTNKIIIKPQRNFSSSTKYYLTIEATAFDDAYGNSFAGINDRTSFSFTTTDTIAPTLKFGNTSRMRDSIAPTLRLSNTSRMRDSICHTIR